MTDYRRNRVPGGTYFFTVPVSPSKLYAADWAGSGARALNGVGEAWNGEA